MTASCTGAGSHQALSFSNCHPLGAKLWRVSAQCDVTPCFLSFPRTPHLHGRFAYQPSARTDVPRSRAQSAAHSTSSQRTEYTKRFLIPPNSSPEPKVSHTGPSWSHCPAWFSPLHHDGAGVRPRPAKSCGRAAEEARLDFQGNLISAQTHQRQPPPLLQRGAESDEKHEEALRPCV